MASQAGVSLAGRQPSGAENRFVADPPAVRRALGRRRYLLAWATPERFGEVAGALGEAAGGHGPAGSPTEGLLLYEARAGRLRPVGSLRLDWLERAGRRLPQLSALSLPGDPWHEVGAVTERNVLLLHGGMRRARAAGAEEAVLLLEPALFSRLARAASFLRLEAGAQVPPGLCRARVLLTPRAGAGGFEAVLSEGRGLERLARVVEWG